MKPGLTLIPSLSIHPDRICTYCQTIWDPCRPASRNMRIHDLFEYRRHESGDEINNSKIRHILKSDRKSHGNVSIQAKRKMLKALDYMLLIVSNKTGFARLSGKTFAFKVAFITLTLPSIQQHEDSVIKNQCLNQFLIELTKRYNVKNYIWRAERQKNGNVHFHILIDKFVDWSELRDRWNRIINKLGYVDRYRDKMKDYFKEGFRKSSNENDKRNTKQQYKSYLANLRTDFSNPNSTDIHSIRKIQNIRLYISKYMTKNETKNNENNQKNELTKWESGRVWGCSRQLSDLHGARTEISNEIENELRIIDSVEEINRYKDTYFTVYYVDFQDLSAIKTQKLFRLFVRYLFEKFGYSYQFTT